METCAPTRVVIAHSYPPLAALIRERLGAAPGWEICGVAYTGAALRILVASFQPDVLILDGNFDAAGVAATVRSLKPAPLGLHLLVLANVPPTEDLSAWCAGWESVPPVAIATRLLPALNRLAGRTADVAATRPQGVSM